ncbi:MAG: hypothetical protein GY700_15815 [Propionibacteriaceae bacterium]|nr:hypothetical protein [Propionibacteriaceae bacterium]
MDSCVWIQPKYLVGVVLQLLISGPILLPLEPLDSFRELLKQPPFGEISDSQYGYVIFEGLNTQPTPPFQSLDQSRHLATAQPQITLKIGGVKPLSIEVRLDEVSSTVHGFLHPPSVLAQRGCPLGLPANVLPRGWFH